MQSIERMTACRMCGCTDDDCSDCVERTGSPCAWVEWDLCSACADHLVDERCLAQLIAASERGVRSVGILLGELLSSYATGARDAITGCARESSLNPAMYRRGWAVGQAYVDHLMAEGV